MSKLFMAVEVKESILYLDSSAIIKRQINGLSNNDVREFYLRAYLGRITILQPIEC